MANAIERKELVSYIDAKLLSATSEEWVLLGEDLESLSFETAAEVNKTKNILGVTKTKLQSYEITASVEPYMCYAGDPLFARLDEIFKQQMTLDKCDTEVINVELFGTATSGAYPAYKYKATIEIVSYGGDNNGLQIPFNLHIEGKPVKGTFDPVNKTFVPIP